MIVWRTQTANLKGAYLETNVPALIALRIKAGYSQRDLAKKLKIDNSTISRIESGERKASPGLGKKIAKALGVPIEAIFFIQVPDICGAVSTEKAS